MERGVDMVFLVLAFLLVCERTQAQQRSPPNFWSTTTTADRIRALGYPAETHQITTEDNYLLTTFRIPHGKAATNDKAKPLIIMHGILCSSDCFVLTDISLGFVLADAGYDVWLPNNRGNTYSRGHLNYTEKDPRFWDFSFHEMGYYDLPANIDYILKATGEESLIYVGHSQGTAVFFVMGSTRVEYNKKIKVMSALAPIAILNNTKGAIQKLGEMSSFLVKIANMFHVHHVLDRSLVVSVIDHVLCSIKPGICYDVLEFVAGFDSIHLDKRVMAYVGDICPSGASVKQLTHFGQLVRNGGKFTWFDYGDRNKIIYHTTEPPEYNLSAISAPVLLYYGPNDYISSVSEVKKIYTKLQRVPDIKEISTYNHLDFMWGKDTKELLCNHMIKVFKRF